MPPWTERWPDPPPSARHGRKIRCYCPGHGPDRMHHQRPAVRVRHEGAAHCPDSVHCCTLACLPHCSGPGSGVHAARAWSGGREACLWIALRRTAHCCCLEASHNASRVTAPTPRQVLHMDRNNYYGGESARLNLNQVRGAHRGQRRGTRGAQRQSHLACSPTRPFPGAAHLQLLG